MTRNYPKKSVHALQRLPILIPDPFDKPSKRIKITIPKQVLFEHRSTPVQGDPRWIHGWSSEQDTDGSGCLHRRQKAGVQWWRYGSVVDLSASLTTHNVLSLLEWLTGLWWSDRPVGWRSSLVKRRIWCERERERRRKGEKRSRRGWNGTRPALVARIKLE